MTRLLWIAATCAVGVTAVRSGNIAVSLIAGCVLIILIGTAEDRSR